MAAQKRFRRKGRWFKRGDYVDDARRLIDTLMKRDKLRMPPTGDEVDYTQTLLSPGERSVIEAIERNVAKPAFDCGIRMVYLAKKNTFTPITYTAMIGCLKQFNDKSLNGFKIDKTTLLDYPWQDVRSVRRSYRKRKIFNAYVSRSYFYPPHRRKPFVLSTEELATIYHFPGSVSETPSFQRIPSKTAGPPLDLPT